MSVTPALNDVIAIVRRVGDTVVLPRFMKVAHTRKADGSVLTEVDLEAQEVLRRELAALTPSPMLGEEMTVDQQQRLWDAGADGIWCVDPVDGTVTLAGRVLASEPVTEVPLSRRYFLR